MNNIKNHDVIVIRATNMLSGIDHALKRSGRFDWKIPFFPPNVEERADLYEHYLKITIEDCKQVMEMTNELSKEDYLLLGKESRGFTSSDIELVCNEIKQTILLEEIGNHLRVFEILRYVKQIKNQGLSLSADDVCKFVRECIDLNIKSSKIQFLIEEWKIDDIITL